MFGARGGACCLLVGVTGCLSAPPSAGGDCAPIVRNRFDDPGQWKAYDEPGSEVSRAPDALWLSAVPTGGRYRSYADVQSAVELAVADSDLVAELVASAEGGVAGIAWNRDDQPGGEDDDFYDLVIDRGSLLAVRKRASGEHTVLCEEDCPAYDPDLHAHLRLRAAGVEVVYQFSGDGRDWSDLARAPLADGDYRAVAFVVADSPGASDLEVTEMAWSRCEEAP